MIGGFVFGMAPIRVIPPLNAADVQELPMKITHFKHITLMFSHTGNLLCTWPQALLHEHGHQIIPVILSLCVTCGSQRVSSPVATCLDYHSCTCTLLPTQCQDIIVYSQDTCNIP